MDQARKVRCTNGLAVSSRKRAAFVKPVNWLFLGIAIGASPVWGGVVAFDPPVVTVTPGVPATFTVSIASMDRAQFDFIDLLFSSDTPGLSLSFTYDPSFETSLDPPEPSSPFLFASDLFVGGVNFDLWQAPIVLGTLRVETSDLEPGTYDEIVAVRPDLEASLFGSLISQAGTAGEGELLIGAAGLVVVDSDADGDGVGDEADAFPTDPTETIDTDGDGLGDHADTDDDNDGVLDVNDDFPLDATETTDTDGDGIGDNADTDDDNDGVQDDIDAFPLDPKVDSNDGDNDAGDAGTSAGGGAMCGVGMIGASVMTLFALALMPHGWFPRPSRAPAKSV